MKDGTRKGAFFTPSGGKGVSMPDNTGQQEHTAEFQAITSQEQLDSVIKSRLSRERAKYADYDELKQKAARLDELEEESKSELQKAQDSAAQYKKELDALKSSIALDKERLAIASEFGISADILRGSSAKELREHAEAIKAHYKLYPSTGDQGERKKATPEATKQEFVQNLFRKE